MSVENGWQGLLAADEHIVWQGQPVGTFRPHWDSASDVFFPLGIMAFSLFWMWQAYTGSDGFFWLFGLIFLGTGFWRLIGRQIWMNYIESTAHYTLTNKRAFWATAPLGQRKLQSKLIDPDMVLELEGDDIGTVWFGSAQDGIKRAGFRNIENPRAAFSALVKVQREMA